MADAETPSTTSGAVLSECGRYRYQLWREWDPSVQRLGFIMLNPSTADAAVDDPTIRRCCGFARREGYGGIDVVNLFAWRATKPSDLVEADNPSGFPENLGVLEAFFAERAGGRVVVAWGSKYWEVLRERRRRGASPDPDDSMHVLYLAGQRRVRLVCLGVTNDGSPRHPLYQRANAPLVEWVGV